MKSEVPRMLFPSEFIKEGGLRVSNLGCPLRISGHTVGLFGIEAQVVALSFANLTR